MLHLDIFFQYCFLELRHNSSITVMKKICIRNWSSTECAKSDTQPHSDFSDWSYRWRSDSTV